MEKKTSVGKRLLIALLCLLLVLVLLAAAFFGFLTATEYRPAEREDMVLTGAKEFRPISVGDSLKVMSWNIGYGALGDNADFFMDGGEMVVTATEERLQKNLRGITNTIKKVNRVETLDKGFVYSDHNPVVLEAELQ